MPNFASLEPQDVRVYWEHEERDFTPWLAEEIESEGTSNLEDALGIDLEVIQTEKWVGKYKLDIYAHDVADNRNVVIENQLGDSDHDHLGKAIAYAAGVDADIIVWVAPEFNDEHRDAIQWLNNNSREGIDVFAIRLEVWRIEDSSPAVRLNPVEKPSEWKEKAKRSKGELSDLQKQREEFWTAFRDRIRDRSTPLSARKPGTRHYYSNTIGVSGFNLSFYVNEDENEMGLHLTIEDSEIAYHELKKQTDEIEAELGMNVEWGDIRETRSGKMRSELIVKRDTNLDDTEAWDEYQNWMMETGERFHEVFPDRLRGLG